MNTHFSSTLFARLHRARACACFLVMAIAGVSASAQQHVAPPSVLPQVAVAAKTQASAAVLPGAKAPESGEGAHEGIKMHGHWVIDVKNPDGTIAEHRDFENALSGAGSEYLTGLISGYVVPSDYGMLVSSSGSSNPAPCVPINSNFRACFMARSLTTSPAVGICTLVPCYTGETYTTNLVDGGQQGSSFKLAGSFTANQDGNIGSVQTYSGSCPGAPIGSAAALASVSPATCSTTAGNSNYIYVSGTTLATPISVVSGQIVQVTVTISFS